MGATKKAFKYISKKLVTSKSGKKYTRYFYKKGGRTVVRSKQKTIVRRQRSSGIATTENPVGGWTPEKIKAATRNIKNRRAAIVRKQTEDAAKWWTGKNFSTRGPGRTR